MISSQNLAHTLLSLVSDAPDQADKVITQFIDFLKAKKLTGHIPAIIRHLERSAKKEAEHNTVMIETSFELSDKNLQSIKERLGATSDAPVETLVNNNLSGGFIAKYQGMQIDASVTTLMSRLSKQLKQQ